MDYNKNQPMTILGGKTPRARIYKSESHKLNQAFNPKAGVVIPQGMPVQLEADGTIAPYTGDGLYIGIAHTDNINPAYAAQRNFPVEVTVLVEGFCIVAGVAGQTLTKTGCVKPTATVVDGKYVSYEEDTDTQFINLHPADQGEIVHILVK